MDKDSMAKNNTHPLQEVVVKNQNIYDDLILKKNDGDICKKEKFS